MLKIIACGIIIVTAALRAALTSRASGPAGTLNSALCLRGTYDMKEVTKEQFKEIYFRLGGGAATGWSLEYWNKFFEDEKEPETKYLLEEPETPEHTRMMIVTAGNEHRLFFWTEESEESFFDFPDKS